MPPGAIWVNGSPTPYMRRGVAETGQRFAIGVGLGSLPKKHYACSWQSCGIQDIAVFKVLFIVAFVGAFAVGYLATRGLL